MTVHTWALLRRNSKSVWPRDSSNLVSCGFLGALIGTPKISKCSYRVPLKDYFIWSLKKLRTQKEFSSILLWWGKERKQQDSRRKGVRSFVSAFHMLHFQFQQPCLRHRSSLPPFCNWTVEAWSCQIIVSVSKSWESGSDVCIRSTPHPPDSQLVQGTTLGLSPIVLSFPMLIYCLLEE